MDCFAIRSPVQQWSEKCEESWLDPGMQCGILGNEEIKLPVRPTNGVQSENQSYLSGSIEYICIYIVLFG